MRRFKMVLVIIVCIMISGPAHAEVDNSLYATVLELFGKNGRVDYAALTAHRDDLDKYLEGMGSIVPRELSQGERLAFYINLYNASTIQLIVDHYPVDSIKDIGSFFSSPWKLKIVRLNGELVTLDYVEHEIIRPEFKDPRVHFALNCSAMSCPPLLSVPFEGKVLDEQLEDVTGAFINDAENNYLEGKNLYLSKIFNWFSEDFPDDFVVWIMNYANGDLNNGLEALTRDGRRPRIRYLQYDWSLNRQAE